MQCPDCGSANPDVAQFCFRCGRPLPGGDYATKERSHSFAIQPSEHVRQLALVSTILPHTNRHSAEHYRWSLVVTAIITVVFTLSGLLPAAIIAGAFLVPIVYLVYLRDANLWQDEPVPVLLAVFLFTGILSVLISLTFFVWVFKDQFVSLAVSSGQRGGFTDLAVGGFLIFSVLLPVVATIAMQVGPVWLATRAAFDDMIDGFTFGVAAGTAYAAFETAIAFGSVFAAGKLQTMDNLGTWLVVILNLMIVKSIIYGTATGIAVGAFSGKGEGYSGFKPSYYSNLSLAAGANVLYWVGIRLLNYTSFGQALGLLWGVVIAVALLLRARTILHDALLESALEAAVANQRPAGATTDGGRCPDCGMPLLADALFCSACGGSVRATSVTGRRLIRQPLGPGREPVTVARYHPSHADAEWEERMFSLSKTATIALIGLIVAAVAGVGLLTGALYGRHRLPLTTVDPTSAGATPTAALAGPSRGAISGLSIARSDASGAPVLTGGALRGGFLAAGGRLAQIQPSPISPTPGFGPSPSESPGFSPSPSLSPSPGEAPGQVLQFANGALMVPVPEGWEVLGADDRQALLRDGSGDFVFLEVFAGNPAGDASASLAKVWDQAIRQDTHYSQLTLGTPRALAPFGSVTTRAVSAYQGLYTDDQGTYEFFGNFWLGIRQDGLGLLMTEETSPPSAWEGNVQNWAPLYVQAWQNYGGAPLPTS
jgi:hypothetical protein